MALYRLLLPKPGHHLQQRALPKSTRWCSSSSNSGVEKSSNMENSEVAKEQSAAAQEPDDKGKEIPRCIAGKVYRHGVFASKVEEKHVGPKNVEHGATGSLGQLSVTFMDSLNIGKCAATIAASNKTRKRSSKDMGQSVKPESHRKLEENNSKKISSHIREENSLSGLVGVFASKVKEKHVGPKNVEHGATGSLGQLSVTFMDSLNIGKCVATIAASNKTRKISSKDMGQSVKPESHRKLEENNSKKISSHIREENSLSGLVGLFASKVKEKHVGPKNVEHGVRGSLVQLSETFMDSLNNGNCVTATAASNITRNRSSKDMGESQMKTSHTQLEEVMLDNTGVLEYETDYRSSLTHQLPGEESRILQKDVANEFTIVGSGNQPLYKRTWICDQTRGAGTDMGKMPAESDGTQQVGLANTFMRTMNDKKSGKMSSEKKRDTLAANGLLEAFYETNETTTSEEDIGKEIDINGLIGCIKELPRQPLINESKDSAILNKTHKITKMGGSAKRVPSRADSHKRDVETKESLLRVHAMSKESNTVSGSEEKPNKEVSSLTRTDSVSESDCDDLKVASRKKPKLSPQVHLPTGKEDLNTTPNTVYERDGSTERKVLVRFLHKNVSERSVFDAFIECGNIVKTQLLPLIEGSNFRDASVHFKTREGSQKALKKTDLFIGNSDAFVQATSLEDVPNKVSIPNLIGNPEVPLALVKNPTRTVMIKQLTEDITSDQLKEALAFCGSGISSFFLGSSSSVAYVEFETEDAKERALAAYSINVQGKRLSIFRIDVPRTTVVRISNFGETVSYVKVRSVSKSYGEVKHVKGRCQGIVDVHFKIAEWPNMCTILNSLNGIEVDGNRWLAQPAPVFPPEVLQALWSRPDKRIHVKSVLRRLMHNNELTVELTNLATNYYKDILNEL